MNYVTDNLWKEAKKVARNNGLANNWLEIVEYYHQKGGYQAVVHVIIDEKQRQIVHILDNEQILLMDKDQKPWIHDYNTVMESKKLFFYVKTAKPTEVEIVIPENKTYKNHNIIKVKVV